MQSEVIMSEKYHFIGIGGIGMSGLARLLLAQNKKISGSDASASQTTESLMVEGAKVYIGHSADQIQADMTVVYSSDIKQDNQEYQAAVRFKCPLIHRSELLQKLMSGCHSLAVAGTHGKTTTSALLTWVLESSGNAPSYAIGGYVPQLGSNAKAGNGNYFVAEACESDGSFLKYHPNGAIVTNIDFDHMDFYGSEKALIKSFESFMKQVNPANLFWCGEDSRLSTLKMSGISYGFSDHCLLRASHFSQKGWSIFFDATFEGVHYSQIEVALIGRHNALNALAVFGLALKLGIKEDAIRKAFKSFKGVSRRCEQKADMHGILFIDDYAHHPTEILATLKALRSVIGERRLVVVYQPHRYTRSKECMGLYGKVFEEADALFVTEIYAAREKPIAGVTHEKIIAEIQQDIRDRCQFLERSKVDEHLCHFLRPHDVVVTLGAGDVTKVSGEILSQFKIKKPIKLKLGIIFGGMSVEHDVSLLSIDNVFPNLRQEYYDIEQFGITRRGEWVVGNDSRNYLKNGPEARSGSKISKEVLDKLEECEIIFPLMHGTYSEDGTMQGFLDLLSKAYVGCDHRSSGICMDKVLTKKLIADQQVCCLPYVNFTDYEWRRQQETILEEIHNKLRYPLFVKPVHLGSSIGVCKVTEPDKLNEAINKAFCYDTKVMVEDGIENVREIEFSVLGNGEITVFPPGEVYANGQLHDYDSKYGQNPAKPAADFAAIADLPKEKIAEGMEMAKTAYQAVGCRGMARVDTFLDPNGKFWFNEINPIPGHTKYSLFPIMCDANGLKLSDLVDRLIILGLEARRHLDRLQHKA